MKIKILTITLLLINSIHSAITELKNSPINQQIENYNKEINFQGIAVVKFYATWCQPCKLYAPLFEQAAKDLEIMIDNKKIQIKYLSLDIDKYPKIAAICKVGPIPTTLFYKNGSLKETVLGRITLENLKNKIKQNALK